jgi:hypothetical protein
MKARQRFFTYVVAYLVYLVLLAAALSLLNGLPKTGPVAVMGLVVLVVGPVPALLHLFDRAPRWQKEVRRAGRLAPAQVLWVKDTGVSTSLGSEGSFYFDLKVRVTPPDEPPFDADLEILASRLGASSLGEVIMVRYDPADRRRIVLVMGTGAAPVPRGAMHDLSALMHVMSGGRIGALVSQLNELEDRHRSGALSEHEFQVARKTLLA